MEDFEISYVRTYIEDDLPEHPPCDVASGSTLPTTACLETKVDDFNTTTDISERTEKEEEKRGGHEGGSHQLRVRVKLSATNKLRDAEESRKEGPKSTDDAYWVDEEDPNKRWYFDGKAYAKTVAGKDQYYCCLCEEDGKSHICFKRREMERHLRRMDHLPPELFCKSAKAVCPCSKDRAFTRIDGRKRHIKISIEHARREAQARKAYDEVERLNKLMKLLETTRGR